MRTISTLLCALLFVTFSNPIEAQSEIQRVRINFQNSDGYTRHLLLGFVADNSATDGFDYGYDALNPDHLNDDLNWIIEDKRCVIQGVGEYNSDKYYPLGMFLSNSGPVSISLTALENFDDPVKVYLYDLELDTYTMLNTEDYNKNLVADTYLNRFYLTFSDTIGASIGGDGISETEDIEVKDFKIWHSNLNNELCINGISTTDETSISIYSMEGEKLISETISDQDSNNTVRLNTLSVSEGLYIVNIESAQYSRTEKICIVHR